MKNAQDNSLKIASYISLAILLYLFMYHLYNGAVVHTIPLDGDSVDYHLPIASFYLNGTILNPNISLPLHLYPSAPHMFLALFKVLNLPINTYNLIWWTLLLPLLTYLGWKLGLRKYYSIIFASTICTLHVIVRWANSQVVDIALLFFYCATLILLLDPRKSIKYFALLGITSGFLIGSKFPGLIFFLILVTILHKKVVKKLNPKGAIAFAIPFSLIGLVWYIRNTVLKGNPFYPIAIPPFKGDLTFPDRVWNVFLSLPAENINAAISEYHIWFLAPLVCIVTLFLIRKQKIPKNKNTKNAAVLASIGLLNLCIYPFLPSDFKEHIMVSSLRYSYPMFIPLILSIFIIASEYKKEALLSLVAISSTILLHPFTYYPKLLFLYIPAILLLYYLDNAGYLTKIKKRTESI